MIQCNVLTGKSKTEGSSAESGNAGDGDADEGNADDGKTEPPTAQKLEVPMEHKSNQETAKAWNIKNLILHGIEIVMLVLALTFHPIYENKPVGALP